MGRELVEGMRLTELMPERLRKRNGAGFGRYVRTGYSRLEGKTVRAPAVDAEGREHEVDLSIRVLQRPDGTRLAVASVHRVQAGPLPGLERIESALVARAYSLLWRAVVGQGRQPMGQNPPQSEKTRGPETWTVQVCTVRSL